MKTFKRILFILALTLLLSGCTDGGDVILATPFPSSQTPEPASVQRPELTPTPAPQITPAPESKTTPEPNTTTEPHTYQTPTPVAAEETVWKKLYLEFLETGLAEQLDQEESKWRERWNFGLIYLDNDGVPELVASSQAQMRGSIVCTVRNDELFWIRINGPHFYFHARGNVLVDGRGNEEDDKANVFKITDDGFVITQKGSSESVIGPRDRTYWENGATYDDMTYALRQVWREYFTTAFERYLTRVVQENEARGSARDDYRYALIAPGPMKGYPLLLCAGKKTFILCDFTRQVKGTDLLLPWSSYWFEEGDTWNVYPDLRMLEHHIDRADGDLFVMDYWTNSTHAIVTTERSISYVRDGNEAPKLDDYGNPICIYRINRCKVAQNIFNDLEKQYARERKFQITPWDAPDNTITYYTADQMLEILHKLGEMVPEEVWTKGVDACLQEINE